MSYNCVLLPEARKRELELPSVWLTGPDYPALRASCSARSLPNNTQNPTPFSAYEHTRDRNNASAPPHRGCVVVGQSAQNSSCTLACLWCTYIRDPTFPLLCAALAHLIWSFVLLFSFNPFASQSGLLLSVSLLLNPFSVPSLFLVFERRI